jgi:uncharacterized protein
MSDTIERRAFATAIRAQGRRLVGYAATFGTPAEIDGRFTETIARGAFSETLGNDVLAMAERGDLGGMSFGFRTLADHWTDQRTRELRAVQLVEVSVVHAFPAYPSTVVQARAQIARSWATRTMTPVARRRLIETL